GRRGDGAAGRGLFPLRLVGRLAGILRGGGAIRLRLLLRAGRGLRLCLGLRFRRLAAGIDAEDAGDHVFGILVRHAGRGLAPRLALGLLAAHLLHAAKLGLALMAVVAAAFVGIAQDIVGAAGLREAHGGIGVVM